MYVAVRYHKDLNKVFGMPGEWPAEVREIGNTTVLPDEPGTWEVMTITEYWQYKVENVKIYAKYLTNYCDERGRPHTGFKGLLVKIKHYLGMLK